MDNQRACCPYGIAHTKELGQAYFSYKEPFISLADKTHARQEMMAEYFEERTAVKKLRVTVNGNSYDVDVEVLEDDEAGASVSGLPSYQAAPQQQPASPPPAAPAAAPAAPKSAAAPAAAPSAGGEKDLKSPIAGIVVEVKASVGDSVTQNDPVVVIEAMKMNTNVAAPVSGKVAAVNVKTGESVKQGQVLMTFE
jgi:biotin carboxyl carrier protein